MKVITGATLIDGTGSPPVQSATVLIEGDRIKAAGPGGTIQVPAEAQAIDGSGMVLLPGLINTHEHLHAFGHDLATRWGLTEPISTRHMRIAAGLKRTLLSGFTTVRDAGGLDAGFRQAVDEGLVPGPHLQVSVAIITPTGGMGDRRSPSGHRNPAQDDPSLPLGVADGPEALRAKVRELVRAGADVIKTATTGGASSRAGLGPKDMFINRDELEATVEEAHGLGRKVMCHALGGPGLRAAIEVGVDSIEHGCYLDEDPDLLPMMVDKNIFFTPTFSVYAYFAEVGPPYGRERAKALRDNHMRSAKMASKAGVKITLGTDADAWFEGNFAQELGFLVGAGLSPMQAIVAATGDAAECIGLDHELGTVVAGKKADLILVKGNPLEDISVLEEGKGVRLVMKDGRVYFNRTCSS